MTYTEWLEQIVIDSEPDWICDKMESEVLDYGWCNERCGYYCGGDWTKDCLKKYYELLVKDKSEQTDCPWG